jgi:hypothetical protein
MICGVLEKCRPPVAPDAPLYPPPQEYRASLKRRAVEQDELGKLLKQSRVVHDYSRPVRNSMSLVAHSGMLAVCLAGSASRPAADDPAPRDYPVKDLATQLAAERVKSAGLRDQLAAALARVASLERRSDANVIAPRPGRKAHGATRLASCASQVRGQGTPLAMRSSLQSLFYAVRVRYACTAFAGASVRCRCQRQVRRGHAYP